MSGSDDVVRKHETPAPSAPTGAIHIMDAAAILGLSQSATDASDGTDSLDGDREELLCENNCGTAADREFDAIIGAIENFLVSPELSQARAAYFAALPPLAAVPAPMERYVRCREYAALLDTLTTEYIVEQLGDRMTLEEAVELIQSRPDEVSDDVMELVGGSETAVDVDTFVAMWAQADELKASASVAAADTAAC